MLSRLIADADFVAPPMVWRNGSTALAARPGARQAEPPSADAVRQEPPDAQIQARLRQAFEGGYREGEAAGRRDAEADVAQAVERLAAAAGDVAAARGEALRRAEADIVRLSIEIARRILHRELSVDADALEALVQAALAKLSAQEVYRVKVHPDHAPLVRTCLQRAGRAAGIDVVDDPSQARGGAVFELSRGCLDASVETQLSEIERGLADRLGERS